MKAEARPRARRRLRAVWAIGMLVSLLASSPPGLAQLGPEPEVLNLFQRVARADLVALVTVREGSLKYAKVEIVETIKGSAPGSNLRIAFRDFNFTRAPGEEMIVFPDGQKEILFLVPYRTPRRKKDKEKLKDLFALYKGRQGRITLPAEGPEIVLDAIRRLSQISGLDAASQLDALRGLLQSRNPFLLEVSLAEIERLRAADPALLKTLVSLLRSPSPALRSRALRVIGQVFGRGADNDSLDEARTALLAVLERARNDTDQQVRLQAVTAIAAWPNRHDVEGDLKAIAGSDQAQAVRYEAQKALFRP